MNKSSRVRLTCLSTQKYLSMISGDSVDYTCTIARSSNTTPEFQVRPSDQPSVVLAGSTPSSVWSQVFREAQSIRGKTHTGSVSGPDYFGLSQPIVKYLIQQLDGARECYGYEWVNYVEGPDPNANLVRKGGNNNDSSRRNSRVGGYESPLNEQRHQQLPQLPPADPYSIPPSNGSTPSSFQGLLNPGAAPVQSGDPYALPSGRTPSVLQDPYAVPGAAPAVDPSFGNGLDPAFSQTTSSNQAQLDPAFGGY